MHFSRKVLDRQRRKAGDYARALSSCNRELDLVKARLATIMAENRRLRQELEQLLKERGRAANGGIANGR